MNKKKQPFPKKKRPQGSHLVMTNSVMIGTLRLHPRGFGFVTSDQAKEGEKDAFIPKPFTASAVDGDRVKVRLLKGKKPEKGPEGEIIAIVQRGHKQVAGIIEKVEEGKATTYVPLLGEHRLVQVEKKREKGGMKRGDRIIIEMTHWGSHQLTSKGIWVKDLGHIDDASSDIQAAVEEYALASSFSPQLLKETESLGSQVSKKDLKNRLDLTKSLSFTIDPDTAQDFDDALSIFVNEKEEFFLAVHIADVAHYVKKQTLIDKEAKKRGNSTYFPGMCIPMLPEALSNDLCSLREGKIRLTVSVLMQFDQKGTLLDAQVERSAIKSTKRFSYDQALQILEGKVESPYKQELKQMQSLCNLLKKKRNQRGCIDFSLPELIILVDKKGNSKGVKVEEYHIAHQLVEEFMLKANEVVAKELSDRGKDLIFRIHEEPEKTSLSEFYSTARALGFTLPKEPTHKDLQNLFKQAATTELSEQLTVGFIRSLKIAYYSPDNVGHYGLALEHYCHFTSPIRRYSDLITQRILFDEEEESSTLKQIAEKCSDKERLSARAESSVRQLKKLRLLSTWMEADPQKSFKVYVTKIKPFGIFFEIKKLLLEGFLPIYDIATDYLVYIPKTQVLLNKRSGFSYSIGSPLTVRPTSIDLIHLSTKWVAVPESSCKNKQRKKGKKH